MPKLTLGLAQTYRSKYTMSAFRIFVNNQRISTCVVLKDKSYLQVFPVKKPFPSKARWIEEWVDQYDSLNIVAQYPKEKEEIYDSETDTETESDAESTSISEEESECDSETEESEEEWQPNSYNNNMSSMDWLLERLWSQGVRVNVPVAKRR